MSLPDCLRPALSASFLLTLAACVSVSAAGHDGDRMIGDGQDFSMQVGERAMLADHTMLRYVGVGNDSRCPPDVQCIWAGDAETRFEWSTPDATKAFSLHTGKEPKQEALGARRLTLVSLERGPAPAAQLRIESGP